MTAAIWNEKHCEGGAQPTATAPPIPQRGQEPRVPEHQIARLPAGMDVTNGSLSVCLLISCVSPLSSPQTSGSCPLL